MKDQYKKKKKNSQTLSSSTNFSSNYLSYLLIYLTKVWYFRLFIYTIQESYLIYLFSQVQKYKLFIKAFFSYNLHTIQGKGFFLFFLLAYQFSHCTNCLLLCSSPAINHTLLLYGLLIFFEDIEFNVISSKCIFYILLSINFVIFFFFSLKCTQ